IVGGFKEALFEDAGVECAGIFGTSRINHDRSDSFERDSRRGGLPGGAEIEREANAARAIMAMTFGDDVVIGDIVNVGEGAPHFAGYFRIERNLVTGIAPGRPAFFVPPNPGLAGLERARPADVGISDVVSIGLERIDIVMPGS